MCSIIFIQISTFFNWSEKKVKKNRLVFDKLTKITLHSNYK